VALTIAPYNLTTLCYGHCRISFICTRAYTYKEQDPWTMVDWQPALEVYLHNLEIARKLQKV